MRIQFYANQKVEFIKRIHKYIYINQKTIKVKFNSRVTNLVQFRNS